jgi:hypothetical protein
MAFVYAEKIEIIVCKVRIPRSQWDCGIGFRGLGSRGLNETMRYMTKILNFIYVFLVVHCCGIGSRGLNETAESDPAVSMRLRDPTWKFLSRFPRIQWDRGIGFRGLNETAEILWHRGNPYENEYWFSFPLKGNHCKNQYICKHCIPIVTRKRQY